MIEREQERQGEVPSEDELDVEGPNESTEPSGAPGLDEGGPGDDNGQGDG
jgi:hypothetical protein